uniref:helix-turn-helix domain-containing protein n=1 Tax=Ndongobacter massiliensis TaxID=1871025 RepID=UPI000930909F|nr:helix-turn-helix transcriptional regulator [Ndongobacter massiliensis]
MKTGEIIKLLRERKGMSQTDLANALNLSRSSVSMYESNNRIPSTYVLQDLSDIFNVDTDYILGKTNKTTVLPERLLYESRNKKETLIYSDPDFEVYSQTRKVSKNYKPVFGNQLLAMTEPTKEAKGAQEQEVEYYPGTDEPTREYMLDFIDREYPTAAFSGGDIHTMNYEELREYYEAVLEEIREEDGE